MLRFHAQTAGSTLTAQQLDNNVVRVALQALAAVLGGSRVAAHYGEDEALALPSEAAASWRWHAADHRQRDRRGGRGGSARRSLALERLTDELEAGRMPTSGRSTSWGDGGGDPPGLPAAGDPGRGLPGAARA